MFRLTSRITVNGQRFDGINEVVVKRSVYELAATATVKVPQSAVLATGTEPPARIETAQAIKPGDKVVIELGYDGMLRTEFRGYVKMLNMKLPLEIICEDEFYTTRHKSVTIEGEPITLEGILKKCELKIGACQSLTLQSFPVDNKPVSWILAKLKSTYGLHIWFGLDGKVFACRPFDVKSDEVGYRLRWNVIKDDDLKFHLAQDKKLTVKAVYIPPDGKKLEKKAGDDGGTEKTIYFYDVEDEAQLTQLAKTALDELVYDGYEGKIETFLEPYSQPTMTAVMEDRVHPERSGRYYIESTEVKFGVKGGRRTVEIGMKV